MKVLLVGSGGREHALGWKLNQSPQLSKLYLAPGSPGLNPLGTSTSVSTDDIDAIVTTAKEKSIDLVIVGPEGPLAKGLADKLEQAGISCFGPSQAAAQLESSKGFMKEICQTCGVPTAAFGEFSTPEPAKKFLRQQTPPYVIKADGLAAGKGVVIADTLDVADAAIDEMLSGKFGSASAKIVIEEFLDGEEASFFVISDGDRGLPLAEAQDHKRAFEGDTGPNTGGMGAYSPARVFNNVVRDRVMSQIINPVIAEMNKRGTPFKGVLFAGLMIKNDQPSLIEFNVRFGDPECQVLMRRLQSDLLPVLKAAADGALDDTQLKWSKDPCALVVMATNGYPGTYAKGSIISGLDDANALPGVEVFHAGTTTRDGNLCANGGRVLNITATGGSISEAVDNTYQAIAKISWPQGFYRKDIAWRALENDSSSD